MSECVPTSRRKAPRHVWPLIPAALPAMGVAFLALGTLVC